MAAVPAAVLAALLAHPEPESQQQGLLLLDTLPELDTPDLDLALAAALLEQAVLLDWWAPLLRSLLAPPRTLLATATRRLGWARRLCRTHALAWDDVELRVGLHRRDPSCRHKLLQHLTLQDGLLSWEGAWKPLPERLILPLPADHPLRADRAWVRRTGRRLEDALDVYLPIPEESPAQPS